MLGKKKIGQQPIMRVPEFEYNPTGPNNPSKQVDKNTNFSLRPITLENIDEAFFRTFNRTLKVGKKDIELILLDAEVAAYKFQHPESMDKDKEFLNLPYLISYRNSSIPLFKTSPARKYICYTIPTQKPQGLVYEEYISPAPVWLRFPYSLKFFSTLRDSTNQVEQQMLTYFKNRRNIIMLDSERFEIKTTDKELRGNLEIVDREGQGRTLYITSYELEIIGYLRDLNDVQKREKPNTYALTVSERVIGASGRDELDTLMQVDGSL